MPFAWSEYYIITEYYMITNKVMALNTMAKGSFLTVLIWIKLIFRKAEQYIITVWFIVSIVLFPSWGEQWEGNYENYHNILSETHLSYINWVGNGQNKGLASPFLCQEILKYQVGIFFFKATTLPSDLSELSSLHKMISGCIKVEQPSYLYHDGEAFVNLYLIPRLKMVFTVLWYLEYNVRDIKFMPSNEIKCILMH